MKIISAIGGGGSTFILRKLERTCYRAGPGGYDPYVMKIRLEKRPALIKPYVRLLQMIGLWSPRLCVLKRPDAFWTDWAHHPLATHDVNHPDYSRHLRAQKKYLIDTRFARLDGLPLDFSKISADSLPAMARSLVAQLEGFESETGCEIVLLSGHWGEYGIFEELGLETIYLIRDPFNSLISHSKGIRHANDYRKRGLDDLNDTAWIDNYLSGPHHYWIEHARIALRHSNAKIVRYDHFRPDWKAIKGLPDISDAFVLKRNDITEFLSSESSQYILDKTQEICRELDLWMPDLSQVG